MSDRMCTLTNLGPKFGWTPVGLVKDLVREVKGSKKIIEEPAMTVPFIESESEDEDEMKDYGSSHEE
ncbi:hypothetical protein Hypma_010633 [Hypsizygus marmoreus]|uniref:Uncharacterized protein n=1 Tax=Hypsizygus marmoreus TaxID=39966 RepID=A0A369JLG8_HYPMA|nr:hypothetical protein Hypma_010633 [Hypsizygus marmoreus]